MLKKSEKKEKVMSAAETLFHHRGYTATSLADIAGEAGIPLGNVYYYFRTKEDLAKAVIDERNKYVRARHASFEKDASPVARIAEFLERIYEAADDRTAHGCPVGSMNQEANKLGGKLAQDAASTVKIMLAWVGEQFKALGLKPKQAAEEAVALLSAVQGSILLAQTLQDASLIRREMRRQQQQLKRHLNGG
jgi:TetR/AcrR family transcriptional repressor of nem operon